MDLLLDHDPEPMLIVSSPKGGHERVLPVNPIVQRALSAYGLPRNGYVFTMESGNGGGRPGRPYTPSTVSTYINRYLHDLGVHCTAHQLRHWFATTVFATSRDLRLTQELLGHASPETTAIYVGFSKKDAAVAVRGLDVEEASAGRRS